jgi:CxxC motif-containing protein (DUF1111 family)
MQAHFKFNRRTFPMSNILSKIAACLLCFMIPFAASAPCKESGYGVIYDGGSLPGVKTGAHLKLQIESSEIRIMDGKTLVATLVPATMTEISYGQDVHRRIGTAAAVGVFTLGLSALTALPKSKKHFVGLTWAAGDVKGGFAVQCDKNDYRGVLAGLEAVTGKRAVDSETLTVKN